MVSRSRSIQAMVLIAFLIALFSNASAQPQNAFGTWYLIVWCDYDGDTIIPFERAETLEMNADATFVFTMFGRKMRGTWTYDSLSHRFSGTAGRVQFKTRFGDSALVVDNWSVAGYYVERVDGTLSKNQHWKKIRDEDIQFDLKKEQLSLILDYSHFEATNIHLNLGYQNYTKGLFISTELGGLSVFHVDKRTFVSSNAAFMLPMACMMAVLPDKRYLPRYSFIVALPMLIHGLTNFDVHVPFFKNLIRASIGQSTDYYFFVNPSRILPETHAGLMFSMEPLGIPLQITSQLCQPWFKGYRDNHNMYFKTTIGWML